MQSGLWNLHIQQRRVLLGAEGVVLADAALQTPGRAAQGELIRQRGIKEHVGDEIKRVHEKMTSVGSPKWDGMPRTHNPQAGEERLINAISEIDILKERYRQAVEYMDWFKPAWEQLSEDDRYCLETFYGDANTYGSSAAYYIAEYLHVEQATAYKRKNRALDRLTVLLFGKS